MNILSKLFKIVVLLLKVTPALLVVLALTISVAHLLKGAVISSFVFGVIGVAIAMVACADEEGK